MRGRILIGGVIVLLLMGLVAAGIYFSSQSEPEPEVSLETARAQLEAGDYQAARDALEKIIASNPNDAEANFLSGLVYFNLQDYQKARESFQRAMELEPERAAAVHHNLGVLAYQTGDMNTAMQEFKAALQADPNDPDSHYQLGAVYLVMAFPGGTLQPDKDLLAQSEAEFRKALASAPSKPEALVGLGNVYLLQNQLAEAIDVLEQAVKESPDMREALFALGQAYAKTGQVEAAKETLNHFLETDPPAVWAQQAQEILAQLEP